MLRALLLALLLLVGGAGDLLAADPPAAPKDPPTAAFLRIETGRHGAVINRLATTRSGNVIASVSDDKTARLWDAATGDLLAVFRVPIGDGLEGALYSVALSPDGARLMVAGYTGIAWDGRPSVYVFDVASEKLVGQLGPLPAVVNHMAFSPDGQRFALSLGKAGVSIHEANGKLISLDKDYQDQATWVAFAPDGQFAAAGADGDVRLYDPQGKRLARRKLTGAGKPFSVEFAPSGQILAVGFVGAPRVEILGLPDLAPRLTPAVGELKQGDLNSVDFVATAQGTQLIAAGSARGSAGKVVMRRWSDAGLGPGLDEPFAEDTVTQLISLGDGKIAASSAEPALRIGPVSGERLVLASGNLDMRNVLRGRFAIDKTGSRVLFETDKGTGPIIVDLPGKKIGAADVAAVAGEWLAPQTSGGGVTVTDWRVSRQTKIVGKPVAFDADERSLSAAVTADGRTVMGTDFRLRLFDKTGAQKAALDLPAAGWAVAASADGQRAVAALGDGTLRFYDLAGDKPVERAALFLHADLKRWVAWLPEGFFDHADEGGKELVGYVLNGKRATAPDWVNFAQVYRVFYAPDLVGDRIARKPAIEPQVAFKLASIGDVRAKFDAATPPQVELEAVCFERLGETVCNPVDARQRVARGVRGAGGTQPIELSFSLTPEQRFDYQLPDGLDQVTLRYKVTDRGGGVGAVDFFLNERNSGRQKGRAVAGPVTRGAVSQVERKLALSPGINRVQLRAYDQGNTVYAETKPFLAKSLIVPETEKPILFVVAAGVDKYRGNGLGPLGLARTDAEGFAATIRERAKPLFREVRLIELYDEAVTPAALTAAFEKVGREAVERDTVLVYLSGHGAISEGNYFYVTQNVDLLSDGTRKDLPKATDVKEIYARALPQSFTGTMLIEALGSIKARNGFVLLDTCHSGGISLDTGAGNIWNESGRYILTAAASAEEALDRYDDKHGVFAAAVIKALDGTNGTAGGDGVVDNFGLGLFVSRNVERFAKEVAPDHKQSARFLIVSRNATPFPIVQAKAGK